VSSKFCYAHDPANVEKRKETASKAGKASRKPSAEIAEVKQHLRHVVEGVLDGSIDKGKGAVAAQALGVLVRAIETTRRIHESEEIVARIEELEREREAAATGGGYIRGG